MLENAIETLEMNVNKISSNIFDEMNENGLRRLRVKFSSIDKVKQWRTLLNWSQPVLSCGGSKFMDFEHWDMNEKKRRL